jgi:hypothetical protein
MEPPSPPPRQRKTSSDKFHLIMDEVSVPTVVPDETHLDIQVLGIESVAHTGLRLPFPTLIRKKVLAIPQNT